MKKVGLLTYHAATNYGAVLQTFAQTYHHAKIGNDCRLINYAPKAFSLPYKSWIKGLLKCRLRETNSSILLLFKFYQFRKKYFKFDGPRIIDAGLLRNRQLDFDVITVGSDQVWNPSWFFRNSYAWPYFLGFAPDSIRKVAIAASLGSSTFPEHTRYEMLNDLKRFTRIGVREKDTCDFICNQGLKAIHDFDPIFLLDKSEWSSAAGINQSASTKNEVFLFFLHNEIPDNIDILFKHFDKRTVFFTSTIASSWVRDKRIETRTLSPFDWVKAIAQSRCVITNSFHATAFCLLFNKAFITLKRNGHMKIMNNRIISLLDEVNMTFMYSDKITNSIDSITSNKIDWATTNLILKKRRELLKNAFLEL